MKKTDIIKGLKFRSTNFSMTAEVVDVFPEANKLSVILTPAKGAAWAITSSKSIISVVEPTSKEGFILVGHGLKDLPKVGDKGKIVFERGGQTGGHWKYYSLPSQKSEA